MAATKTVSTRHGGQVATLGNMANNLAIETGEIAMDTTYPTGGETLTFPGFASIACVQISPRGGYLFEYDVANSKVKAWKCKNAAATGASAVFIQAASGTNLGSLSDVAYVAFGFV